MEGAEDYRKLVFVNRQPTLWRHGIPAMEIIPNYEDGYENIIGLSNLSIEPFNAD